MHECLDVPQMKTVDCFKNVLETLEELQLLDVLQFSHGWNKDLINQFHDTLYVTCDRMDISTGEMEWMTDERRIKCST